MNVEVKAYRRRFLSSAAWRCVDCDTPWLAVFNAKAAWEKVADHRATIHGGRRS